MNSGGSSVRHCFSASGALRSAVPPLHASDNLTSACKIPGTLRAGWRGCPMSAV